MRPVKENRTPFVCHSSPSVCCDGATIAPFVFKKTPSIGFDRFSGFTMTEFVTTVAIAGILMGIAVPSIGRFIESSTLVTVTNDLIADINVARGEAIKRGFRTVVCESSNGTTCSTTGDWRVGWMVFVDSTENSAFDIGSNEVRVRYHDPVSLNHAVTGGANFLTFDRMGLLLGALTSYRVCNTKIDSFRQISISTTGRASLTGTGDC
jgi:type IV fimbrial biogenesis protein FimT